MKKENRKKYEKRIYGILMAVAVMVLCMEETVYAATNKSGCESNGTVTAAYDTSGTAANGYYKKNGKVVVTYNMGEPAESCSNTTYQYVGITNKVEAPQIDASETNVTGGGHVCNGHTSNTASWQHWFGLSGSILYGMSTKDKGSVTVTEEEYNKCKYAIAGPSTSFGDGIGSDGKFKWIVLYKKLPSSIDAGNIDDTAPNVELSATPSGKVAVNPVNGKKYGTEAILTAVSTDNESRPHKTKTFLWKGNGTNLTGWISANSENKKSISTSYKVTSNGAYAVETQDQLGNSAVSRETAVDFIDLTEPWAALSKSVNEKVTVNGKEWTSTTVTLKATASDSGAGLASTPYCFDKVTWTLSDNYVISQNGTYQVRVRDALGNVTEKSITIDNFDRLSPEGEVTAEYENSLVLNGKQWSKEGVFLKVSARDSGCGLDSKPYSFDGGVNWTDENNHVFQENGVYQIKIRDSLHNTKTETIEIGGIDKEAPVIEQIQTEPKEWKEGNAVVVIDAKDDENGCGLAKQAYSFDGGSTWTDKNEIILTQTTELKICVRDYLGNVATETYVAKCTPDESQKDNGNDGTQKDDNGNKEKDENSDTPQEDKETDRKEEKKEPDKENEIEEQTGKEKEEEQIKKNDETDIEAEQIPSGTTIYPVEDAEQTETETGESGTKKETGKRQKKTVSENTEQMEETKEETYRVTLPVLEEEQEPIQVEEYSKDMGEKKARENTFLEKLCIMALIAILLLGLLGLFLWYLFVFGKYRAVLYGKEDGTYKRLGYVTISKKEEQDYIEIPDELLQKIEGNCYRIKLSALYVMEREGMEIYLGIEESMLKKQVKAQIDFYVEE